MKRLTMFIFLSSMVIYNIAAWANDVCPNSERRVGVFYSLWHEKVSWPSGSHRPWGMPEIGFYKSDDEEVLRTHADQMHKAGIDFVVVDWSNNLGADIRTGEGPPTQLFIEHSTIKLFDVWKKSSSDPTISIMIGFPNNKNAISDGTLAKKADEVYDLFVKSSKYNSEIFYLDKKPLLLVYVNTPSPWSSGLPDWDDKRFTVRFVTGYISDQPGLRNSDGEGRFGYWSWEDRNKPTVAMTHGHPESMTVVAAWRGKGSPGRQGGETFRDQWMSARRIGPCIIMAGTFNEWWVSEQISAEQSKDIEPSVEFGSMYLDIVHQESIEFKEGK